MSWRSAGCLVALLATGCSQQPLAHWPARQVSVLGQQLNVEIAGSGESLILVPGGCGGSHDYFHPWLDRLADGMQVITYDALGRGRSAHATNAAAYTFEREVEELEALRVALGLGPVSVLGHSCSGFVAQAYAQRYPGSVRRLILANTFARGSGWQEATDQFNITIRDLLPETWAAVQAARAAGAVSRDSAHQAAFFGALPRMLELFYFFEPTNARHIVFSESNFNPAVYYTMAGPDADFTIGGTIGGLDFRPQLPTLTVPVLVLAGRRDHVAPPRFGAEIVAAVPGARWHVFERSGHFPFIEEQDAFLSAIRTFMAGEGRRLHEPGVAGSTRDAKQTLDGMAREGEAAPSP
jgi:proline iminopeptidase